MGGRLSLFLWWLKVCGRLKVFVSVVYFSTETSNSRLERVPREGEKGHSQSGEDCYKERWVGAFVCEAICICSIIIYFNTHRMVLFEQKVRWCFWLVYCYLAFPINEAGLTLFCNKNTYCRVNQVLNYYLEDHILVISFRKVFGHSSHT